MKRLLHLASLALMVLRGQSIELTLYSDKFCSVMVGAISLDECVCSPGVAGGWAAMEVSGPPSTGVVTTYSNGTCGGYTEAFSGLFLGCMHQTNFTATSAKFTAD